jgi:hypothetical protein
MWASSNTDRIAGYPTLAFEMGLQTLPSTSLPAESRIGRARRTGVPGERSLLVGVISAGPVNAAPL